MANWFRGGLDQWDQTAQPWPDASSLDFRASLIEGPSIVVDPDWQTLDQLLAANPGKNLVALGGKNVSLSGRFVTWSSSQAEFWLALSDAVFFTGLSSGIDVAGVIIHEQDDSVPANCVLWGFDDSGGQTLGGSVRWGTESVSNIVFRIKPNLALPASGIHSTILAQNNGGSTWNSRDLGHSLIKQGSPTRSAGQNWQTVQEAIDNGLEFCTGTGPNEVNEQRLAIAQRRVIQYDASNNALVHLIAQGNDVVFSGASFTPGEVMVGVLSYLITGTDVANARIWSWDEQPAKTLATNQDIRYGNTTLGDQNTQLNAIV